MPPGMKFGMGLRCLGYALLLFGLGGYAAEGDAATVRTLHHFPGGERYGSWSQCTPLVMGSGGILYGTTYTNPDFQGPGLYRVEHSGAVSTVASIDHVYQPLVSAPDGTLYGYDSGNRRFLRVFSGGEISTVAVVPPEAQPLSLDSLAMDPDGTLYWASSSGYGSIYSLSPSGKLLKLYEFDGSDVRWPSILIVGRDGYLYGAAGVVRRKSNQVARGSGVIFRLSKAGEFKTLHKFKKSEAGGSSSLLSAKDGNLYGTRTGPANGYLGYVFKLDLTTRDFTILHRFRGANGMNPSGPLTEGTDGYIYGTTQRGGPGGHGVIYRFRRNGKAQIVYAFSGLDGAAPIGGLVQKGKTFFGVTRHGGSADGLTQGTVFELSVPRRLSPPGRWDGLLRTSDSKSTIVGNALIRVTASDTFTMALHFGNDRVACHGKFGTNGRYIQPRATGQHGTYAIELHRSWTGHIHGRVSSDSTTATFDIAPGVPGSAFPRGRGTHFSAYLSLSPNSNNEYPADGVTWMHTTKDVGRIRITGRLPDGTPFSTRATVGLGMQIGLYAPLIGGYRGILAGTLDLAGRSEGYTAANKLCPGRLLWNPPGQRQIELSAFFLK